MKKLLARIKGGAAPAPRARGDEEPGFFSTMFTERGDETQLQHISWATRCVEVGAEPFDRQQGAHLFAHLWAEDRHVADLGDDGVERLCQYLEFVTVPAGREVIDQDEQGDYMIIVLEGTLAVDRVQPWGGRARLSEARAGDMLGEMSLLDAGARFSACTTLTPCTLAVIDAQRLDQLMNAEPRLALALLASLSRRLSLRLRQVSARLSALLSRS
ncbi:MAG: cyclic nucleotide-binding domain-containing protein [Betaproteobacteria bacterium]|nr:MAG: cyclic nucleotide-binding domain-containing protein [Betaproteobacteria bacterium]